jgi:hypothetical protein
MTLLSMSSLHERFELEERGAGEEGDPTYPLGREVIFLQAALFLFKFLWIIPNEKERPARQ